MCEAETCATSLSWGEVRQWRTVRHLLWRMISGDRRGPYCHCLGAGYRVSSNPGASALAVLPPEANCIKLTRVGKLLLMAQVHQKFNRRE